MCGLVESSRGGKLSVDYWGPSDGFPVFLMHGTPGSRNGPRPRTTVLHWLGVKLIGYDRPGYGDSTRQPGRAVCDAADDVRAIADNLELDTFAIVGRSGGGPHAMACAEAMPDRVTKLAVLVSLAPAVADDLDWYEGMNDLNRAEYGNIDRDDTGALNALIKQSRRIREDPEVLLDSLGPQLTTADRRVVEDADMRRLLLDTYREALKHNEHGWLDDVLAFRRSWGFDPADIKVPMLLWHGAEDRFSPINHMRWLAERIPQAKSWIQHGAAHFSAMEVLPSVLSWVSAPTQTPFVSDHAFAPL